MWIKIFFFLLRLWTIWNILYYRGSFSVDSVIQSWYQNMNNKLPIWIEKRYHIGVSIIDIYIGSVCSELVHTKINPSKQRKCLEFLNKLLLSTKINLEWFRNSNSRITENQRLTTYGFDPLDNSSDGYTEDKAYGLRLTAYGFGNRIPRDNPYWRYLMTRVLRGFAPSHSQPRLL